mmetsp:Transcript_3149/g.6393  ORF Transcript_3149/g.6393 Transcript_3149/m.6393 type:complete len:328 (+) Transcript_3149:56-1039(+)
MTTMMTALQPGEHKITSDVVAFVEKLMLESKITDSDKEALLDVIAVRLQALARPSKSEAAKCVKYADRTLFDLSAISSFAVEAAYPTLLTGHDSKRKRSVSMSPHLEGRLAAFGNRQPQEPLASSRPLGKDVPAASETIPVWIRPRMLDRRHHGSVDRYRLPVMLPSAKARLRDLRSSIRDTLRWPRDRVERITFTSTLENGEMVLLSDEELAASAQGFYVREARKKALTKPPATRASLAALQRELLTAIQALGLKDGQLLPVGDLREIQAKIFPRFGFDSTPSGIEAMESAFDFYMPDAELLQLGDEINKAISVPPCLFDLSYCKH